MRRSPLAIGIAEPADISLLGLLVGIWILGSIAVSSRAAGESEQTSDDRLIQLELTPAADGPPPAPVAETLPAPQASPTPLLDPLDFEALVQAEVRRQLAATRRAAYTPATDTAPPKGLKLYDAKQTGGFPFSANIDGFMQVRWFEFARGATGWQNAAGQFEPISNINSFNINRFMITPYGYVVDERIIWSLTLFGTTDNGKNDAIVPLGVVGWKFNDNLSITGGTTFVASTREWIISNRWMQGVDRSMANTFFRPSYSPGVEANGTLADDRLTYRAGVWNSIQGATSGVLRKGTSMAWAGNVWWEPNGPFGLGYSDMEYHDDPVWRIGTSGLTARTEAIDSAGENPEDTIVRLSDGTPIALPNVLGAGSTVNEFDLSLATIDAGWKYRGIALNFEYYFRLIDNLTGVGTFDRSSLYDQGGQAYVAWCVVPRTYEFYGRSSAVTGPFGTGQEYGGGFNWYWFGSRQSRFTFEALHILRSPADNILYPYRAGYTGTAIQTQLCLIF
jgi:hypothetical protein